MFMKKAQGHSVGRGGPFYIVLQILLVLVSAIQLFPLLWMLTFSLKTNEELFGENILGLPRQFQWQNYQKVFTESNLAKYLFNSAFVTLITILLTCALSAMVAFAVTRMRWKLSKTVFTLFLTGMMVPIHAVLLPLFITLRPVLNTRLALIIPYVGFGLSLSILILSGFLSGIPRELEEAACIDGASIYRIFFTIILPLTKPAMATISILTFMSSWNELMFAITFVNKEEYKTITYGVMSMVGRYTTNWGPIGAGLVVATIPTIILYIFMSEQIQASLAAGAVKG